MMVSTVDGYLAFYRMLMRKGGVHLASGACSPRRRSTHDDVGPAHGRSKADAELFFGRPGASWAAI